MRQAARLITPDGKAIELPAEVYRQVKRLLDTRDQPKARLRRRGKAAMAAIIAGYGLLAGDDSLTQALLTERSVERAREIMKVARLKQ